eukprot:scaffold51_cov401-Prasinococcus_capsulatus_cf.AAC.14
MRTEKWKGTVNQVKAQPSFVPRCVEPFVEQLDKECARAKASGFKALYMAGDAMPGVVTSFTYRGDAQAQSREYYEDLTLKIWKKAEDNGLAVIRYPPESDDYNDRAIMDQIICARSGAFISTCHHQGVRDYEVNILGAQAGSHNRNLIMFGDRECKGARHVCGNYGSWIARWRRRRNPCLLRYVEEGRPSQEISNCTIAV